MNGSIKSVGCFAAAFATAAMAHGTSFLSELYNTGVDDAGINLATAAPTQDTHYSLTSDPAGFTAAYAVEGYLGYWATADYVGPTGRVYGSQWISPLWNNGQAGEVNNYPNNQQFDYKLNFNLDSAKGVDVKGAWMADNGSNGSGLISQILINGLPSGQQIVAPASNQYEPFNEWHPFELTGDLFQKGANSITFSVTNWPQAYGNPTGLRVVFTSADTQNVPGTTPEPYTLALGMAAFTVGIARHRARKK